MLRRIVGCAAVATALASPVIAGEMSADEARRFVVGKMFAFNCFDGTRGAGRIHDDGSVAGSIQIGGAGPVRYARLPSGTLRVKSGSVCASVKGLFFEPCFNLVKTDDYTFRGSVSGMGFAYCTFTRRGGRIQMASAARRASRPVSLTRPAERVVTHHVEAQPLPAPGEAPHVEPASLNLRPTAD
ncbi:MAG: hypothetical protein EPO23_12005 [Xanthobacteraceae bacterium]|nr:MAG: hypothetical protein EPO23_12005 [Xanthobacteraceae bacterium]